MSAYAELLQRIPSRSPRRVTVTCVTELTESSPFTVYIDGDTSVAVRARIMAGSTFTSGESGLAYWTSPSLPECFKVT